MSKRDSSPPPLAMKTLFALRISDGIGAGAADLECCVAPRWSPRKDIAKPAKRTTALRRLVMFLPPCCYRGVTPQPLICVCLIYFIDVAGVRLRYGLALAWYKNEGCTESRSRGKRCGASCKS